MCSKLTETAADDLLAFVRKMMREGGQTTLRDGRGRIYTIESAARPLLAKHGLLTMADDPEVARVFMEDGINPYLQYTDARLALHVEWDSRAAEVWVRRYPAGSPARMSYVESGDAFAPWDRARGYDKARAAERASAFVEGEPVTLVCVGGLATDPRLDPGTPAEGQRIAHGAQGVVDCAGTHNVGVVFDGYEGSVRVPASMLRRV